MYPLRVAFLWHQHQPDYRFNGSMWLPWVRVHAGKDYLDLPKILAHTPGVRHTFNLVPSLLAQLDAVAEGMSDPLHDCLQVPSWQLTPSQQRTLAHYAAITTPALARSVPRFEGLVRRCVSSTWESFSEQDWTDLQITFLLTWTGPTTRRTDPFLSLLRKGALFTDADRLCLLDAYTALAGTVVQTMTALQSNGLVELSTTPFDHPILPLLIATSCAAEALPSHPLPEPPVVRDHDAHDQIQRALDDVERRTGHRPPGMWPAEGSISMEALSMLAAAGILWTATDQGVLYASLGPEATAESHFMPWRVETTNGPIVILFRDREISDAIGFRYATWDTDRAVTDFLHMLEERRRRIIAAYGEDALRSAVVGVFLDGENCWEFYPGNGEAFLRTLMARLESDPAYSCITCSEAALHPTVVPWPLSSVRAGSWIDASFEVWIGTPAKNRAWEIIGHLGQRLDETQQSGQVVETCLEQYRAMQASDTFWWLDERHQAPHKYHFEQLFRKRAAACYAALGEQSPFDLDIPLTEYDMTGGRVRLSSDNAAMHRSDVLVDSVGLETHDAWQRLTIQFRRWPTMNEQVVIDVMDEDGLTRACQIVSREEIQWRAAYHDEGCTVHNDMTVALYLHTSVRWRVEISEDVGTVYRSWAVLAADCSQPS
jgi:alpha-amylase/alpha-mannosidase (GH57 family)